MYRVQLLRDVSCTIFWWNEKGREQKKEKKEKKYTNIGLTKTTAPLSRTVARRRMKGMSKLRCMHMNGKQDWMRQEARGSQVIGEKMRREVGQSREDNKRERMNNNTKMI